MSIKKRAFYFFCACCLLFSLVGCGKKEDNENAANADVSAKIAVTTDTKQEEQETEAVPTLQEVVKTASGMPSLTAQSAILVNADTSTILAAKDATITLARLSFSDFAENFTSIMFIIYLS